jgi:O-acetylhomoserine (thiol)-lyase
MMNAHDLREKITSEAERLGLTLLGFAPVERWQETGNQKKEAFPKTLWPWSKTVIVGGLQIFLPMGETTPSNLYSELYNTTNRILDEAAYRLANILYSLGHRAHFFPRDGYGEIAALVEKPEAAFSQVMAAKYAGLGTIGANHCLLTEEFGPRVRLVSVITDAELPPDPTREKELCVKCGQCERACPIGAFTPRPGSLIADMEKYKCAQYHQFLRQELRYPCGSVQWRVRRVTIKSCTPGAPFRKRVFTMCKISVPKNGTRQNFIKPEGDLSWQTGITSSRQFRFMRGRKSLIRPQTQGRCPSTRPRPTCSPVPSLRRTVSP